MRTKIDKESMVYSFLFAAIFYSIAIWRYLATGKIFYIYNFGYLGTVLSLAMLLSGVLPKKYFAVARHFSQLAIGLYLVVLVGLLKRENLQIEGFWFYLFAGTFSGATLHYFIAKICGTVIFGRGWCSWACWTAMFLDLLPWKKPQKAPNKKAMLLRYLHFALVLALAVFFFYLGGDTDSLTGHGATELRWFITGNIAYYLPAFILAFILKDNRAFCKYLCPIPVLQKPGAKFALLKIEIKADACIDCGRCEAECPMQVPLLYYKNRGERILSTECIFCLHCVNICPKNAIRSGFRLGKLAK